MKTSITHWVDLIGKSIATVQEMPDETIALVFTDDTCAIINSGPSYDGERSVPELEAVDGPTERYLNENQARALAQAGIWTTDEYTAWKTARENWERDRASERESDERATLARLKAKYDKVPG